MRLFRGIAVPAESAQSTISRILACGLDVQDGKTYPWQKPEELARLLQKRDLSTDDTRGSQSTAAASAVCACGDEASAAVYAWKRNKTREHNTPILIEFDVELETIAIDGRDFLYTAFQLGTGELFRRPLVSLFGEKILQYVQPAWESQDTKRRLALCDLAIYDSEIVRVHHASKPIIGGRYHTRFRNSFLIRLPVKGSAILRAWTPAEFAPLPDPDFDVYKLRAQ